MKQWRHRDSRSDRFNYCPRHPKRCVRQERRRQSPCIPRQWLRFPSSTMVECYTGLHSRWTVYADRNADSWLENGKTILVPLRKNLSSCGPKVRFRSRRYSYGYCTATLMVINFKRDFATMQFVNSGLANIGANKDDRLIRLQFRARRATHPNSLRELLYVAGEVLDFKLHLGFASHKS